MFISDYPTVWMIYLVCAFLCFLSGYYLTKWLYRPLHNLLVVVAFVMLFSPTHIGNLDGIDLYAPSSLIVVLDVVFKIGDKYNQAITDLLQFSAIAAGIYLLFAVARFIYAKLKQQNTKEI